MAVAGQVTRFEISSASVFSDSTRSLLWTPNDKSRDAHKFDVSAKTRKHDAAKIVMIHLFKVLPEVTNSRALCKD
ncbi:MAG: hypothetical protein JWO91_911 [Acidobacteriaceae bacterium]|jgi:hypothetical protein|nr:hypothetical protein [Acidobacteriaceae bacterium]